MIKKKVKTKPNLSFLLRRTAKRLGKTEGEVLTEIEIVCGTISNQISFGYYDKEDIKQEGVILGIAALIDYDFERPLSNFIFTHVRNRILNLQRKLLTRTDPPCLLCHQVVNGHSGHADGKTCESYKKWHKINSTKYSLMQPTNIGDKVDIEFDDDVVDEVEKNDLLSRIDTLLPVELRCTYLRMRANEPVALDLRHKVEIFIKELISHEEGEALEEV